MYIVIPTIERRRKLASKLANRLSLAFPTHVLEDDVMNLNRNHVRAWSLAAASTQTEFCGVMQDDVILCEGFNGHLERILEIMRADRIDLMCFFYARFPVGTIEPPESGWRLYPWTFVGNEQFLVMRRELALEWAKVTTMFDFWVLEKKEMVTHGMFPKGRKPGGLPGDPDVKVGTLHELGKYHDILMDGWVRNVSKPRTFIAFPFLVSHDMSVPSAIGNDGDPEFEHERLFIDTYYKEKE